MEITYEIVKRIGILSTSEKGWTKEINLISWNGNPAKYDIRDWSPEDENGARKMSKGITLSEAEIKKLKEILEVV